MVPRDTSTGERTRLLLNIYRSLRFRFQFLRPRGFRRTTENGNRSCRIRRSPFPTAFINNTRSDGPRHTRLAYASMGLGPSRAHVMFWWSCARVAVDATVLDVSACLRTTPRVVISYFRRIKTLPTHGLPAPSHQRSFPSHIVELIWSAFFPSLNLNSSPINALSASSVVPIKRVLNFTPRTGLEI